MARARPWLLLVLAPLACAHPNTAFRCEASADCTLGGQTGSCEQSGWCSFADATCASGRRYGAFAGDGLAGVCAGAGGDVDAPPGPDGATPDAEVVPDGAPPPDAPAGAQGCVAQLALGEHHTCALRTDGTVWCWGGNDEGQLGDGTTTDSLVPVRVTGLAGVAQVVAGGRHSCARTTAGLAWCWGRNKEGQNGDNTETSSAVPRQVVSLTDVRDLSTASEHSCAARGDGTVWCWGWNGGGILGDNTSTRHPFPVQAMGLTTAVDVEVGLAVSCALTTAKAIRCWGPNDEGQLGDGTTNIQRTPAPAGSGLMAVADLGLDDDHVCAVLENGDTYCWGSNRWGAIGDGAVDPFTPRTTPFEQTTLPAVADVETGSASTCARADDGGVWCWGYGGFGQLGDGTAADHYTPARVAGLGGVIELAVSAAHACVRQQDRSVRCWGYNGYGQLGDGTRANRPEPTIAAAVACP